MMDRIPLSNPKVITVKIWYDVSELLVWRLPHLTGIQRTTVKILDGLFAQGASVGLVRYEAKTGRFLQVAMADLPAAVRYHLRECPVESGTTAAGSGAPHSAPTVETSSRTTRHKIKLFKKNFFIGSGGEAQELRNSFRQFKTAARQLRKSFGHWARRRLRQATRSGQSVLPPSHLRGAATLAVPAAAGQDVASFANAGDVLMALNLTWAMRGYDNAIAGVRARGVKVVRMIYDLIPTIKPQWLDPKFTRDATAWVRALLLGSDHVLTISEFTRQEIEHYCRECGFAVPPLTVVRLGDVMEGSAAGQSKPPLPRFAPTRPFFICVSTIDVRKNHRLLYDAWTHLVARRGDECPDLLCIGTPHLHVADLLHEIRQDRGVNRHIHLLHGIKDCELEWYYQNCQATIYPSKYEGWGLPVAESLGHGRMCLASNATSIPEISRDLPAFFDPYDVHGFVALVERVLDEPEWVRDREATIREKFRPTGWHETAAQVLGAITTPAVQGSQSGRPRLSPENAPAEPALCSLVRTSEAA